MRKIFVFCCWRYVIEWNESICVVNYIAGNVQQRPWDNGNWPALSLKWGFDDKLFYIILVPFTLAPFVSFSLFFSILFFPINKYCYQLPWNNFKNRNFHLIFFTSNRACNVKNCTSRWWRLIVKTRYPIMCNGFNLGSWEFYTADLESCNCKFQSYFKL